MVETKINAELEVMIKKWYTVAVEMRNTKFLYLCCANIFIISKILFITTPSAHRAKYSLPAKT